VEILTVRRMMENMDAVALENADEVSSALYPVPVLGRSSKTTKFDLVLMI